MKNFTEFFTESELAELQRKLKDAETPEEIERLTKLINTKKK